MGISEILLLVLLVLYYFGSDTICHEFILAGLYFMHLFFILLTQGWKRTWPNWYYSCYYAETSQLISSVKQFTGFYMIEVLVLNGPTRYNMLFTRFRFQWKFLYKISFLRHYPISCHCSLSIPLQNIWFSDVFRGYRKRPITWNELKT